MTKVTEDQFEWDGDKLAHKPTGATFNVRSTIVNYGRAGDDLEDGTVYWREDIYAVAHKLAYERRKELGLPVER